MDIERIFTGSSRDDLGEYYIYVISCSKCGKKFGTDFLKNNFLCPECDPAYKIRGWKRKKHG